MNNLNISNIEQSYQSSLRADYLGKVQEVAKLHDEIAKLQTRLLDIEHENHTLKIQLAMAKGTDKNSERVESESTSTLNATVPTSKQEDESKYVTADGSSKIHTLPLKRARSPSLELIEVVKQKPKKLKAEAKTESPESSHRVRMKTECSEGDDSPREDKSTFICGSPVGDVTGTPSTVYPLVASADSKDFKFKRQKSENPKVFSLPQSVTDTYLQTATTLEIHPPPLDLEVSRRFLWENYGGSNQHFLQFIQADRNPSGPFLRRVVFPMLNLNPSMPSQPGDSGLVFASRIEILSNPPWTLFCKRIKDKALWWYLGEYECVRVGTMTADDFKAQSIIVQREWAKRLLKQKNFDVYVSMRARIALRLASIIPVDDKEEEARIVQQEVLAIKSSKGRPLSEEDIIAGFCRGDEGIDIILMKCIKYDHNFANDMKSRFTSGVNKTTSESKRTRASKKNKPSTSSASSSQRSSSIESSVETTHSTEENTRPKRLRKFSRKMIESID